MSLECKLKDLPTSFRVKYQFLSYGQYTFKTGSIQTMLTISSLINIPNTYIGLSYYK